VRQVGHLPELYEDARSEKHKQFVFLLVIYENMGGGGGVSIAITLTPNLMKIGHVFPTLKQYTVQSCLHEYRLLYYTGRVLQNQTTIQISTPISEVCSLHIKFQKVILQNFINSEPRRYIILSSLLFVINPLNPELNPICYLLALLAHHFLHVSRIRVKSLTLMLLMSYIYGAPILEVSRSHTTTHHSR